MALAGQEEEDAKKAARGGLFEILDELDGQIIATADRSFELRRTAA